MSPRDPARVAPARVALIAPRWLGDAVMALPAMAALRARFPGAHLTVAAPPSVAGLFREDTDVHPDAVLALAGGKRESRRAIADGRFDLAVLFPNSFGSAWQLWRAGVPARWGYAASGRGWLLTTRASRPRGRAVVHQTDYYRALAAGLGAPADARPPRLAATSAARAEADALLNRRGVSADARLVGFAPGAAFGAAKQWPLDRVAALAARLIRERDVTCVILGAPHDRPAAREIESCLRRAAPDVLPRVIDLVGHTSLTGLIGVVDRTAAFVSNDSGAMHVAAALGKPVTAIFGPTDERATRPAGAARSVGSAASIDASDVISVPVFCRPCQLHECPIDHRCMKRITVERVAAAVFARLDAAGAR